MDGEEELVVGELVVVEDIVDVVGVVVVGVVASVFGEEAGCVGRVKWV